MPQLINNSVSDSQMHTQLENDQKDAQMKVKKRYTIKNRIRSMLVNYPKITLCGEKSIQD